MKFIKSLVLVALQFIIIFWLVIGSSISSLSFLSIGFIGLALALLIWAVFIMQKSKLRIFPEPSTQATLIIDGPYRYIRHPMYTSILLGVCGLLIDDFTLFRLGLSLALTIVLIFKLDWEEKLLSDKFDGYSQYMKFTKRLVPYIY
ncbi:MAG: isoprenylcysteine carboxylmethyltransferase family protein [Sphingobacteriia bacterium]|nr:MAG: isoprenylcysteine carboxylmethyltransferase family protein [Sphingobacteriia bacterium]